MMASCAALGPGANAENQFLRRFAQLAGIMDDVEGFIASEDWVDLLRVFDDQFITGYSSGLKLVAPLAGYQWPVDEPGGAASMLKYDVAVGGGDTRQPLVNGC